LWTYVRTYAHTYVCMHIRTYVCTHARTHKHLRPALLGRLCRKVDLKRSQYRIYKLVVRRQYR